MCYIHKLALPCKTLIKLLHMYHLWKFVQSKCSVWIGCLTRLFKICNCIPLCTLLAQTWYVISTFQRNERCYYLMLRSLYCNVLSPVNETWGNLAALHSTLHHRSLSSYCRLVSALTERVHVFRGGMALQSDYAGRVEILLSKLTCYR